MTGADAVAVPRLGLGAVGHLPAQLRPLSDPRALPVGVVHLGIGAFHRAHQAVMTEDAIAAGGGDWGICGVTQRSRAVVDQLAPQDGLYTVAVRDGRGERLRVVGAVREVLWAQADAERVLERIATPQTRVITVTVTEKGYHHDPATGRLRLTSPPIAADLADGGVRTVVAQLARGLERRRRRGGAPVTVVSCDNLPGNGRVLHDVVRAMAMRLPAHDDLADWIEHNVRFPSTMVDRIVPATTDADRARIAAALGYRDEGAVVTEPFCQWVIENAFAAERPAWEQAGATLTDDVAPYEQIKLRLLNGSHSMIAYLGALADDELVVDAVGDADAEAPIAGAARALMVLDAAPTLRVPAGFDLRAYRAQLMERFANPALRHRTLQIATDGSQKLPQRLLGTIRDRRRAGAMPDAAALAVAAWMRFVTAGRSDGGRPLALDDPLAEEITRRTAGADTARRRVEALLGIEAIFGDDLPADTALRDRLAEWLEMLTRDGAARTAARVTAPAGE